MGCFDTLRFGCPSCKQKIEYQSKAHECALKTYTIFNAPLSVLGDAVDYGKIFTCECGKNCILKVQTMVSIEPIDIELEEER